MASSPAGAGSLWLFPAPAGQRTQRLHFSRKPSLRRLAHARLPATFAGPLPDFQTRLTVNIIQNIKKVPGGLMIVPMLVTALINTFCPQILQIGGPTTALFTAKGTMACIGIILFITGSQFKMDTLGMTLKRGLGISAGKVFIGFASAWLMMRFFGLNGFWGISTVALVTAMVSCNPGVYIALVEQYGDPVDKATFGPLNVLAVPSTPLLILGAATGAGVDYMIILAVLAPFILGMILGNLDPAIRGLMAPGTPIILPFIGFCFGSAVDLKGAATAGFSGLLLAILFLAVNVPIMLAVDKYILRRPGYASIATCSVAGISVVVPTMLAATQPAFAPYVKAATAQIALVLVITSFIVPWLTAQVVKAFGDGRSTATS